jgi:tripartite-type tricarboxylate transporter receptor subunit TctC
MEKGLGQSIIIDNRPAAGGVLARRIAAEAAPDGYTLLMLSGSQTIGATLVHHEPVDMRNTYAAVSRLTSQPYLLLTNPSIPAKNVKEMIAYAKAHPGQVNYGSTGAGSSAHLAGELLAEMANIKIVHVPYKGASPGLLDLIRGQIQMLFASAPSSLPHVKAGRLRLLAQSSGERSGQLPDVPTVAESGLPGFDVTGWYAVVAPARTPAPIIAKLNREIGEVLKLESVQHKMAADGTDVRHSTPEELTALVSQEVAKWTQLVKKAGIHLN